MVEHNLAKVGVASSSLVFRSIEEITFGWSLFFVEKGLLRDSFSAPMTVPVQKTPDHPVRRIMFHVIRLGFEPKTHSLEGCCSIQLSRV